MSQHDEKDEEILVNVADAIMEATREVNLYRAYPQDLTLSTNAVDWWLTKNRMPNLQYFAGKYLPFPVGESDVERVFLKTGMLYCPVETNCYMLIAR